MNITTTSDINRAPDHLRGLLRHFADLRDGTHGDFAVNRADKEKLFIAAIDYLAPYARQALGEMNDALLLASGTDRWRAVSRINPGKGIELRSGRSPGPSRNREVYRPLPWRHSSDTISTNRTCAALPWGFGPSTSSAMPMLRPSSEH